MSATSIEDLRRLLAYSPETGAITWKLGRRGVRVGAEAGSINALGYRQVMVGGRQYLAHRLAYALHYGEWPAGEIDHMNQARSDNRIANLRVVTTAGNAQNRKLFETNTSGRVGVHWGKKRQKWVAQFWRDGKQISLGRFSDFSDACAAREAAEREHGYHPNHGRASA